MTRGRRRSLKAKGIMFLTILGAALVAVPFLVRAQQPDVDRQVEEAKALYRDGSFAEAIVKLQDAISRLQLLRDIEVKRIQLAEAYLHMSLSYFALDNSAAAKETLKGLARLDRQRRLDPQIYAPPVIALFEEARAEVLLEPAAADARPSVRPAPSAAPKKGGSKAPLIVLGAAAAAGGVALAAKGGGSAASSGTPAATPTASPTPTPSPSASADIVFIGSDPAPGSTISTGSPTRSTRIPLRMTFSAVIPRSGLFNFNITDRFPGPCMAAAETMQFTANVMTTFVVQIFYPVPGEATCPLPFTTQILQTNVTEQGATCCIVQRNFVATYTFVP